MGERRARPSETGAAAVTEPLCIDCRREGVMSYRKIVTAHGQPARCTTHKRSQRSARSEALWAARIWRLYALTVEDYWAIYEAQGGVCALCQRARGLSRRLSVDHDHETGLVRGLLCNTCNKFLGHLRDSPHAFVRGAYYLLHPPAFEVIGRRVAPMEEVKRERIQPGVPVSDDGGVHPPG